VQKANTYVLGEKLSIISDICDELFVMVDSLKLQAVLASDNRIKERFDDFAEELYSSVFSIQSLANTSLRTLENFEIREDVYKQYSTDGY